MHDSPDRFLKDHLEPKRKCPHNQALQLSLQLFLPMPRTKAQIRAKYKDVSCFISREVGTMKALKILKADASKSEQKFIKIIRFLTVLFLKLV